MRRRISPAVMGETSAFGETAAVSVWVFPGFISAKSGIGALGGLRVVGHSCFFSLYTHYIWGSVKGGDVAVVCLFLQLGVALNWLEANWMLPKVWVIGGFGGLGGLLWGYSVFGFCWLGYVEGGRCGRGLGVFLFPHPLSLALWERAGVRAIHRSYSRKFVFLPKKIHVPTQENSPEYGSFPPSGVPIKTLGNACKSRLISRNY